MLSIPHLIVIFVVALVVFGPEKLPELARNLGKVMAEFRRHTSDLRSTFEGHLRDLEREADARKIGGASQAPPSTQTVSAEVAPPSSGTVPSNTPYAAAVAAAAAERKPEEASGSADAAAKPAGGPAAEALLHDPANDPYLMATEFAPEIAVGPSEPSESEKTPEQVTDGDIHPA